MSTKIIGVTGGKGGTGKSTVATSLSYYLSRENKVLLIDADVECPNDHLLLNIERREIKKVMQRIPQFDFQDGKDYSKLSDVCQYNAIVSIKGKKPIFIETQCNGCGACMVAFPQIVKKWDKKELGKIYSGNKYNIDFLSGELKINEPLSERVVEEILEIAEKEKENYDYIIVDTAAGTHCDVISSLEFCDFVLAVTEPTPLGEHDAELIIKLADRMKKPFDVILNRYEGDEKIIRQMLHKYNKEIFHRIPYKKEIMEAYSKGIPIKDDSLRKIVKRIIDER